MTSKPNNNHLKGGFYATNCEKLHLIVTSQFLCNVSDVTLVPNFGRIIVASLSNVKCSVMLWSDNRNIMDYWMFVAGYCFEFVF